MKLLITKLQSLPIPNLCRRSTPNTSNNTMAAPVLSLVKKQFTPSKIFFHILFWGFHFFIFGYGW